MDDTLASSLSALGATAFRWSAVLFVLLNGGAALVIWLSRSRTLVNRLTPKLLLVDVLLLGSGIGVPIVSQALAAVVRTVSVSSASHVDIKAK